MTKNALNKTVIKNKNQSTKVHLLNGKAMNKKHPDTFWIPDEMIRMFAPVGMLVKIATNSEKMIMNERFWVQITKRSYDKSGHVYYKGTVENRLCFIDANVGDTIEYFEPKHIIDIDTEQFIKDVREGVISVDEDDLLKMEGKAYEEE